MVKKISSSQVVGCRAKEIVINEACERCSHTTLSNDDWSSNFLKPFPPFEHVSNAKLASRNEWKEIYISTIF